MPATPGGRGLVRRKHIGNDLERAGSWFSSLGFGCSLFSSLARPPVFSAHGAY